MKKSLLIVAASTASLFSVAQTNFYPPSGNVGIGTSSAATLLHVNGGHIAASTDDNLSGFVQLWNDNAIIWKQGNALRFGSAANLGAGSWSEKMRITDAGNVCIGTFSPTTKLHVEAFTNSVASLTAGYFNAESSSTDAVCGVQGVARYSNSSGLGVRLIGVSGIAFHLGSGSVTSMRAVQGNASVLGSGAVTDAFSYLGSVGSAGGVITNGYGIYITMGSNITNKWGVYINDATAKNYFGGSVSIGTTSDFGSYKLAVNGDAIFTKAKVKLYSNWPDYVFHIGY